MTKAICLAAYMRVRTKPDKREEFLRLIGELRSNVHRHEAGTLLFEVLQGNDANEFVIYECFTDVAAQQLHQNAPYHVAMAPAGWACLDGQPVIEYLRPAV
jgi:quinol monooxygenase YgiN